MDSRVHSLYSDAMDGQGLRDGGATTEDGFTLVLPPGGVRPRLRWSDRDGAHVVALAGRVLAGSAPDVGLVVVDPTVSRLHAELDVRDDGSVWIRDLGSKNGSFVEGVQVEAARLPRGARIRLGSALLTLELELGAEPIEVWQSDHFGALAGKSLVMRRLFGRLSRIAATDASVLVHGETGTGKELVARAIHEASGRAAGPLVIVDCAAIPEQLVESQLFGHVRGAFTGAVAPRVGDLEAAAGGTVFLDEIGELPLAVQPKLLRALESRAVRRVGETEARHIDVRFVSATHRDLRKMVNAGAFREDLYFRLAVVPVTVPPLRERLDDLEILVASFLPEASRHLAGPGLIRELATRPWLGNVRELRNFVARMVAVGTEEALHLADSDSDDAAPASAGEPGPGVAFEQRLRDFREAWSDRGEREYLARLLDRHRRNVARAAAEAGVDRTYLYRLMRKHEL